MWAPVRVLSTPVPIQLPAYMAWENSQGWPGSLGPCTYVGDADEAHGSWLHTSLVLAIGTI